MSCVTKSFIEKMHGPGDIGWVEALGTGVQLVAVPVLAPLVARILHLPFLCARVLVGLVATGGLSSTAMQ